MRSEEEKKEQRRKAQKKYYEKNKEYYRKQSIEENKRVRKERNLYKEIIKEVREKIENTTINCDGVAEDLIDDIYEILDKVEDKKIEKIQKIQQRTDTGLFGSMVNDEIKVAEAINKQANYLSDIVSTINEIIDKLNEMEKE